MMRYKIEKNKVYIDGKEIKTPTEEQKMRAVFYELSMGNGLDSIFVLDDEFSSGKKPFMYLDEFLGLIESKKIYTDLYEEADRKRIRMVLEKKYSAGKKFAENPTKENKDIYKAAIEDAKVSTQEIVQNIVIQNNKIFPDDMFTNVHEDMLFPEDIKKTKAYKNRVAKFTGLDPDKAAFYTHFKGIYSEGARKEYDKRKGRTTKDDEQTAW